MFLKKFSHYFFGSALLTIFVMAVPQTALAGRRQPHAQSRNTAAEGKNSAASSQAEQCKADILLDAASGDVLSEQNSHEALPPASMIKMLTAYSVLKQIRLGVIKPEDVVTVSAMASKIGGSQVYLKEGESFTVKQLLEALLIQSANDAAVALAQKISGDPAGFVEIMRIDAQALGLKDFEIHSVHGLPPSRDQLPDKISAADLALLGRALITEFPDVLRLTGAIEADFRDGEFVMRNHNHLLRTFEGCDGIKTGYYAQAGFGVTATAQRNGLRLITTLMGCPTSKIRDREAARLLSIGFARYRQIDALRASNAPLPSAPVSGGSLPNVSLEPQHELKVTVPAGDESHVKPIFQPCAKLIAPVVKGTQCGSVSAELDGRTLASVPLVAGQDVPKGGFMSKLRSLFR